MDTLCYRERWGLGNKRTQDKGLENDREGYSVRLRDLRKSL